MARTFSPRANGIGLLRLALACAVFVAHCGPLGLGGSNIGGTWTRGQVELGGVGVYGFFALSGFLITGSARRTHAGRFLWHRALRIYPGLWACLLVTALVLGPLLYHHDHGTTAGYWSAPQGPFGYLVGNWWGGLRQFGLSGLFTATPYGRVAHTSVVDGSLWTLSAEICCYLAVAVLAFTGVLRRAPRLVLVLAVWAYLVLLGDFVAGAHGGVLHPGTADHPRFGPLPLLGVISLTEALPLLLMFMLGAAGQLYADRIPMHPALAGVAAVLVLGTAALGGFAVIGLPAYAYLLLALACYLPARTHGIGRRHDYSYGIYIYAFPAQQLTAELLGMRWHLAGFAAVAFALTVACAVLSWHAVERPMLRLKDLKPFPVYRAEQSTLAPVATGQR